LPQIFHNSFKHSLKVQV